MFSNFANIAELIDTVVAMLVSQNCNHFFICNFYKALMKMAKLMTVKQGSMLYIETLLWIIPPILGELCSKIQRMK